MTNFTDHAPREYSLAAARRNIGRKVARRGEDGYGIQARIAGVTEGGLYQLDIQGDTSKTLMLDDVAEPGKGTPGQWAFTEKLDPNIGRRFLREGSDVGGSIVSRQGDTYQIRWDDGGNGSVAVDWLATADAEHLRSLANKPRGKRNSSATTNPAAASVNFTAAEMRKILDNIRAGAPLDPNSPDFSRNVAARVRNQECLEDLKKARPGVPPAEVEEEHDFRRMVSKALRRAVSMERAGMVIETAAPEPSTLVGEHVAAILKFEGKHRGAK
jgi:hypothetical protein